MCLIYLQVKGLPKGTVSKSTLQHIQILKNLNANDMECLSV